jgi:ferritin-like metal-binding protein YciE
MGKQRATQTAGRQTKRQETEESDSQAMENPLHDAFLDEVADIYNAEQQLTKALPKMSKAAQSEELREALEEHLEETEQQIQRIEDAMSNLDESIKRKKCKAMEGLIAEANEMLAEYKGEASLDAVIIAAAQKIEHYEIASYGTLCAWAKQMSHDESLELFQETLEEEKAADEKLTQIAESLANVSAEEAE